MEELSWDIEQEISSCILEGFSRVLSNILEDSTQWHRRALRDCMIHQGGDFRGSAISEKLSGFSEYGRIPEFQNFLRRGTTPNPHLISSSSSSTTVSQQHPRRGHSSVILSVFLHFPGASRGAILLITSCTHSITQYNKMAYHFSSICLYYYMLHHCYFYHFEFPGYYIICVYLVGVYWGFGENL